MAETDLRAAVRRVMLGDNKVCDLTRPKDAATAYQAGAIYGGLIFVGRSARYVAINRAREVISGAPLKYVGVFCNEQVMTVAQTAKCLGLQAIQLYALACKPYSCMARKTRLISTPCAAFYLIAAKSGRR